MHDHEKIKKEDLEELFTEFLKQYLENVKKKLPESYRAIQLNASEYEASLVFEFETRFLKQPFMDAMNKALSKAEGEYEERIKGYKMQIKIEQERADIIEKEILNDIEKDLIEMFESQDTKKELYQIIYPHIEKACKDGAKSKAQEIFRDLDEIYKKTGRLVYPREIKELKKKYGVEK